MKGTGEDVDSAYSVGSQIVDQMGVDWGEFLTDSHYEGMSWVVSFGDSDSLEAYFPKSKDKDFKNAPTWPVVRFSGDLTTDVRVKGYGLLVVDGDVLVTTDKLEWTGLILVGGTLSTIDDAHFHVKGALATGLGCTDQEREDGDCRNVLSGDHNDFKYRPCEINQAWTGFMRLQPLDDLFREASPNG